MKRKLLVSIFAGILFLGTAFVMTSCSDSSDDFIETAWNIENFNVTASQWSWNSNLNRWEAVRQLPAIDEFIYEDGVVHGFIFLGTQGVDEVRHLLPFFGGFFEVMGRGGVLVFTERLSFELSILKNG